MNRVFIGLGSNVGDRLHHLQRAVKALGELPGTSVKKLSAVYETEPVGLKDQPTFLNAVVEIETTLEVKALYAAVKEIERAVGRVPRQRWGPREIDLDLLYYNDVVLSDSELSIPHPEVSSRRFVLIPLAEIAPEFIDPVRNKTVLEMVRTLTNQSAVHRTTSQLRRGGK
jgi:2-amino-4-hydroxy-6-hydroxymethyldihydropteridine diphosphokinase